MTTQPHGSNIERVRVSRPAQSRIFAEGGKWCCAHLWLRTITPEAGKRQTLGPFEFDSRARPITINTPIPVPHWSGSSRPSASANASKVVCAQEHPGVLLYMGIRSGTASFFPSHLLISLCRSHLILLLHHLSSLHRVARPHLASREDGRSRSAVVVWVLSAQYTGHPTQQLLLTESL